MFVDPQMEKAQEQLIDICLRSRTLQFAFPILLLPRLHRMEQGCRTYFAV